jgi:glycosyltransferase involved in cell wall biosynthesis
MNTKINELSLFLPVYNEEAVIEQTITKCNAALAQVAKKYEILVVNDGSHDKTETIVNKIIKKNPSVRMITHNPNKGYGGALKTGLYQTKYKHVAFIDADGQIDITEIKKFMPHLDKFDVVIGYRYDRADPPIRKAIAFMLKLWNLLWFQFWVRDTDCAFKIINRKVLNTIPTLKTESAITTTELLIKAKQAGFKFKEIPVEHYERVGGQSTGGNPKVILRAAKDTLKLWWVLKTKR